jgi:hypothetical protein
MQKKPCTYFMILISLSIGKCVFSRRFGATALLSDFLLSL